MNRTYVPSILARYAWILLLVGLIVGAEVALRIPAVTERLPDPTPRLWHALLVQEKLDYLATMQASQGVDLLFVGNSTTQAGINPLVFDQTRLSEMSQAELESQPGSFNAGIEGLPPVGIDLFLPIFLKRAQPDVIVYGLSAQDLNSNSPWAADVTDRVNHSPLVLAESERGPRGWFLSRLLNVSQLYRYRPVLLQMLITGKEQETHLEDVYFDERGHDAITYRTLAEIPVAERGFMANSAGVLNYNADGLQAEALVAIIEQSKALGIELILVNMPLADDYYNNFDQPSDYQRYRTKLGQIAQAHNISLIDMEDIATNFTDAEFADFNHLNASGAERLSRLLAAGMAR